MKLNCIRTNSTTGIVTNSEQKAFVRWGFDGRAWVYLEPGITGYESASVDDLLRESRVRDWCACAGTEGSWDKLIVPENELERLKDFLRLIPQPDLSKK